MLSSRRLTISNAVIAARAAAVIVLMGSRKKITISWSGGKDAALALHRLLTQGGYQVDSLHCVFSRETGRVGLHGVHESLIQQQADAIGVPLIKSYLASGAGNESYDELMLSVYQSLRDTGVSHIAFGDIFLEDIKTYRETLVQKAGLTPLFPLWNIPSEECIRSIVDEGFRVVICAANERCFNQGLMGKEINPEWMPRLPADIDPCGENGEFHTFVTDAPYFKSPVRVDLGRITTESHTFHTAGNESTVEVISYYQDLLPATEALNASNSN